MKKTKFTEEEQVLLFSDLVDDNAPEPLAVQDESDNSINIEELDESAEVADKFYKEKLIEHRNFRTVAKEAFDNGITDDHEAFEYGIEQGLDEDSFESFKKTFRDVVRKGGGQVSSSRSGSGPAEPPKPSRRTMTIDEVNESDASDELKALAQRMTAISDESSVVESAAATAKDKFDKVYKQARNICTGRAAKRYLLVYGDGGVGKTYNILKAVEKTYPKQLLGYEQAVMEGTYSYNRGSVGRALTQCIEFFYRHRNDNLIVLDDCDSLLLSTDEAVQKTLKGIFDNDLTMTPNGRLGQFVTVPSNLADKVNKTIKKEGVLFQINRERLLKESVFEVKVGNQLIEEKVDAETRKHWLGEDIINKFEECERKHKQAVSLKGRSLLESEEFDMDDYGLDDETAEGISGGGFYFTAPTIFISNMDESELDEAVRTRFTTIPVFLTKEEFIAHAETVLPHLKIAVGSAFTAEEIEFGKKEVHGALKYIIEAEAKNISVIPGRPAPRVNHTLQFRMYNELFGFLMGRIDSWLEDHEFKDELIKLSRSNPKAAQSLKGKSQLEIAAYFIQPDFILRDMLPYLEKNDRGGRR